MFAIFIKTSVMSAVKMTNDAKIAKNLQIEIIVVIFNRLKKTKIAKISKAIFFLTMKLMFMMVNISQIWLWLKRFVSNALIPIIIIVMNVHRNIYFMIINRFAIGFSSTMITQRLLIILKDMTDYLFYNTQLLCLRIFHLLNNPKQYPIS